MYTLKAYTKMGGWSLSGCAMVYCGHRMFEKVWSVVSGHFFIVLILGLHKTAIFDMGVTLCQLAVHYSLVEILYSSFINNNYIIYINKYSIY